MKKIIIPISTLLVTSSLHSQTITENYIQTRTYLEEVTSSSTTAKQAQTVQYFDGLGRPKQVVNVKASPLGRDVVKHIVYDGFGRELRDYLPVPQSQTLNGAIITDPLTNATQPDIYGSEKIYSEKIFENSPLDKILQQKQVGNSWDNKPIQFDYGLNIDGEVKKYTASTDWANKTTSSHISFSGNYGQNLLYKNTVTDEDGNISIEFKNGRGQTILVRKNDGTQNVDTYYVYDNYQNLVFVIPPLASVSSTIDDTILNDLCYQYRYDIWDRLVEKKLPGKGWEYMVYDKQDRLVATQDANLRPNNQWLYTKYDQFGRVVMTGLSMGYGSTRLSEQDNADTTGSSSVKRSPYVSFIVQGMEGYYENYDQTYPNSSRWVKLLSVNYYDTYPAYGFNPTFPANILGQPTLTDASTTESTSTKSLPVMSLVKNIEDDNWTKNYTYYDKKGRPIGTYSINHLGGYTKTESKLDFAGVVTLAKTYHKRLDTDTEKLITETFEYDSQNRLLVHKHKVNNNTEEILAQNTYNELSQLTNKKVGGIDTSTPLQSIDYTYNIRGWMTKINDPANLNGKLFGYKIKYNEIEGQETPNIDFTNLKVKPKYNGNIAEVDWRTGTVTGDYLRRYGYVYDNLNRLLAGFYQKDTNPSAKEYFEKMDYDLNGNITYLKRSGAAEGTTATNIDDLTYIYSGNRLTSVTDSSTDYRGYPDVSGNEIPYDGNGNMTSHEDKGILQIEYNYLNLPNFLKFNQTYIPRVTSRPVNIRSFYQYNASGEKMKKIYLHKNPFGSGEESVTTDYLDGFQYESKQIGSNTPIVTLKFVPTAEGYYNFENNKYIYNYTDHLGNVRVSYFNNGTSAEVLEENNYYPFGMKHEGYNPTVGNPAYTYSYNGKELQTESGMYDYGARMYMPDLGRWGVVDPLAEKMTRHSPYNYAFNNPIRFIDPDGRKPEDDFRLLKTGKLELIRKTNSDETKGVHTIYNEDNSKSVTVNKEIIDNRFDGKSTILEGDKSRITDSSIYISTDKKSMNKFFNFIKDNVTNEFSLAGYKTVKDGGKEVFAISTEYKKSQEGIGGYMAWKILNNKNMKMTEFTHLHPGGTLVPSGFNGYGLPTEGDRGNKIIFENDFYKNRTPDNFKIVVPKSNETIIYDSYKFDVKK